MKNLLLPVLMTAFTVISADALPNDLLKKLDADEFATRSKAQDELMKWAKTARGDALKELKQAFEKTESPEVKMRLSDVLENTTFMAKPGTRGFVGIDMNPQIGGVGILMVQPDTPAQKVDLRVGDSIIEVDGKDMTAMKADPDVAMDFFSAYVKSKHAGQKLELKINRNGKILEKTLKLGDYDAFNRQSIPLNGQQLQLNKNELKIQPNGNLQMQLEIVPRGVNPKVPGPNNDDVMKEAQRLLKEAEKQRNQLNKRKENLHLELEKLKLRQKK